ncbi:MAG TPA: YggT family protein [Brevefilum sp.]|nr:YggT family protein [Brevefilum sp.]
MGLIIVVVNAIIRILILAVFIYVLLRYFIDPNHPVITTLGRIVEPLLAPIQKHVPPIGGLDLSPLILMIGLQILGVVVVSVLRRFG